MNNNTVEDLKNRAEIAGDRGQRDFMLALRKDAQLELAHWQAIKVEQIASEITGIRIALEDLVRLFELKR